MNHHKHERTHKSYIRALKELRDVEEKMRKLPYRKLETPYQSGWNLNIALRDDFKRSKKGEVIQALVEKFAVNNYTRSAKMVSQIRKKPQLADVRARFFNLKFRSAPDIRGISKREYNALTDQQKKYFYMTPVDQGYNKSANSYLIDVPVHYLLVKVEKRIITHVRDVDPELLSREAELKLFLEPYWREKGYGYDARFENRSERRAINVELSEVRKTNFYERDKIQSVG